MDAHKLAGWICLPFILLSLFDGYWKVAFLSRPLIYFWAYDFAKWFLLPVILLGVLHRLAFVQPRDYGLSADLGKRDILYVLPLPLITLFIINFSAVIASDILLSPPKPPFNHSFILAPLRELWIVGTLYLSATAGLWESVFLIGLPWLWFSRSRVVSTRATHAFILVTGLLFAAGHWENGIANVIGAFLFQLGAVWWYLRLGTLWPTIGAHFLIDVVYFWPPAKI